MYGDRDSAESRAQSPYKAWLWDRNAPGTFQPEPNKPI